MEWRNEIIVTSDYLFVSDGKVQVRRRSYLVTVGLKGFVAFQCVD